MSSSIYKKDGSYNPYREGVLIGNYVEDMFGLDLKNKYKKQSQELSKSCDYGKRTPLNFQTSNKIDYRWPSPSGLNTLKNNNENIKFNYDLNIDFRKKDLNKLLKPDPMDEFSLRYNLKTEGNEKEMILKDNALTQRIKILRKMNAKETGNIMNNYRYGTRNNLLFGYPEPHKGNLNSVYDLSFNKNMRTQKFLDPLFSMDNPYKIGNPADRDYMDWGYRKYKEYGFFTKKIDVKNKNK